MLHARQFRYWFGIAHSAQSALYLAPTAGRSACARGSLDKNARACMCGDCPPGCHENSCTKKNVQRISVRKCESYETDRTTRPLPFQLRCWCCIVPRSSISDHRQINATLDFLLAQRFPVERYYFRYQELIATSNKSRSIFF